MNWQSEPVYFRQHYPPFSRAKTEIPALSRLTKSPGHFPSVPGIFGPTEPGAMEQCELLSPLTSVADIDTVPLEHL